MSHENVELVMSLYEAVQRREYESPFEVIDENILWDMSGFGLPDMAKVYRGHDGIREFWSSWLAAWEMIEFKALAAEDYGDHVIVEVKQHNRGRESGVEVDFHYFQATTVRDGKITASYMAETKARALEAAGLQEEAVSQENVVRGVRYPVSLPSERASQRRSLDEHLFARFPGVYRLFADAWMKLPPGSRHRRLFLRRLVGRACAAANRRDFDLLVLGVDPGVEHRPAEDLMPLDWGRPVAHGQDGYQQVWRMMMETFDDFRAEPAEILDLGDKLLVTAHYKGTGSGSGIPIDETLFQLRRLRKGLVVWQKDFSDRSEALEAAGLSE